MRHVALRWGPRLGVALLLLAAVYAVGVGGDALGAVTNFTVAFWSKFAGGCVIGWYGSDAWRDARRWSERRLNRSERDEEKT